MKNIVCPKCGASLMLGKTVWNEHYINPLSGQVDITPNISDVEHQQVFCSACGFLEELGEHYVLIDNTIRFKTPEPVKSNIPLGEAIAYILFNPTCCVAIEKRISKGDVFEFRNGKFYWVGMDNRCLEEFSFFTIDEIVDVYLTKDIIPLDKQ